MKRILSILTKGFISISSSDAINSSSVGVMEVRRLAGRAIVSGMRREQDRKTACTDGWEVSRTSDRVRFRTGDAAKDHSHVIIRRDYKRCIVKVAATAAALQSCYRARKTNKQN